MARICEHIEINVTLFGKNMSLNIGKNICCRERKTKTQLRDRATENAQCISHFILQCHQKTGRVVHLKWCKFNSVAHSWELFPQDHVQKKLLKLVKKICSE